MPDQKKKYRWKPTPEFLARMKKRRRAKREQRDQVVSPQRAAKLLEVDK